METDLISVVTAMPFIEVQDTVPSQNSAYSADSQHTLLHASVLESLNLCCTSFLYDCSNWNLFPSSSQQPFPERLRIRVSRISMHDYEALHYDKEKLKEACEYETHINIIVQQMY